MITFHTGSFRLFPRFRVGLLADEWKQEFSTERVYLGNWLGLYFVKFSKSMEGRVSHVIKLSCEEIVTISKMHNEIGARVRKEVNKEVQWLRDSQSDQIARRIEAEKKLREVERERDCLVKSMQIIKDHALDDGK